MKFLVAWVITKQQLINDIVMRPGCNCTKRSGNNIVFYWLLAFKEWESAEADSAVELSAAGWVAYNRRWKVSGGTLYQAGVIVVSQLSHVAVTEQLAVWSSRRTTCDSRSPVGTEHAASASTGSPLHLHSVFSLSAYENRLNLDMD